MSFTILHTFRKLSVNNAVIRHIYDIIFIMKRHKYTRRKEEAAQPLLLNFKTWGDY